MELAGVPKHEKTERSSLSSNSHPEEVESTRPARSDDEDEIQHDDEAGMSAPLEKTTTRRSVYSTRLSLRSTAPTVSVVDQSSIPDGGLQAWLQVLGSFFLFFNSWGIINSFGTMQTYYMEGLLADSTPAAIAWIGSVQAFLLGAAGPLIGPLYDAGYFHAIILTGSFLVIFGHMMLSLATAYWQVFLSQAVCVGLGCSCLFVPAVTILSTYFRRRLATAVGIAAAGSSLGGVIYPIVLYRVIPTLGFSWAVRIVAFMALATLIISNSVMRIRTLPAMKRKIIDWPSFKEAPYVFFLFGNLVAFMGLYPVFVYVESFAQDYGIMSTNLSFYSLAIVNAGSVFGRIIPNFIADQIGPFNVIIPASLVSGLLALCLIASRTTGSLVAILLLYGFSSGALVSLPPACIFSLSQHRKEILGTRFGMGTLFFAWGLLLGTPIGGWILAASSYNLIWVFAGCALLSAAGLLIAARQTKLKSFALVAKA